MGKDVEEGLAQGSQSLSVCLSVSLPAVLGAGPGPGPAGLAGCQTLGLVGRGSRLPVSMAALLPNSVLGPGAGAALRSRGDYSLPAIGATEFGKSSW